MYFEVITGFSTTNNNDIAIITINNAERIFYTKVILYCYNRMRKHKEGILL